MGKVSHGPTKPAVEGQVLQATGGTCLLNPLTVLFILFPLDTCYFHFDMPGFDCILLWAYAVDVPAWGK